MALFCDFENVALGVRDAKYDRFDIKRVLERLLLKGSIVVKKAYCDWERYKHFKATMHEANFELIEIPHVRQSGKNSADIRLVVDALDLCYTKSHVDTFVIISGDSDFSPLVSKLRENAKQVIGVGVKQSTSDLLIANCDEFIFYDDLVREGQRAAASRRTSQEPSGPSGRRPADDEARRGSGGAQHHGGNREESEARRTKAIDLAVETFEALGSERGDGGKIRASVLKDAIKRRKPDFNENYFGFRSFGSLLEEAQARGLLEIVRDDKANAYVQRAAQAPLAVPRPEHRAPEPTPPFVPAPAVQAAPPAEREEATGETDMPSQGSVVSDSVDVPPATPARKTSSRRGSGSGGSSRRGRKVSPVAEAAAPQETADLPPPPVLPEPAAIEPEVAAPAEPEPAAAAKSPSKARGRSPKTSTSRRPRKAAVEATD